jgi:hypothetical protein
LPDDTATYRHPSGTPMPIWTAEDVAMSLTKRLTKGRCLVCRQEFPQSQTGRPRLYCSDAHRSLACYWRNRPRDKAFQRVIREQVPTLALCRVEKISNAEAKNLILVHEWLASMPRRAQSYGLRTPTGALLGATVFGHTMSPESHDLCGKENRSKAICLLRGACVPYAPHNAASFLISRAVRMASQDHGWTVFFAYADSEAGESGQLYRALNWLRIQDTRAVENYIMPGGESVAERTLRHRQMTRADVIEAGGEVITRAPKRKYVAFVGDKRERRVLRAALRSGVQPY